MLKYRNLFTEHELRDIPGNRDDWDMFIGVGPSEYFEDETGKELTHDDIARIVTGSPTARSIPPGAKQHDIDLMLAEPRPIPLAAISLPDDSLRLLGYFVRDLKEMMTSAFLKDGPGTLTTSPNTPKLTTAVTDDEIRSFVTIFRRLYMTREPANFLKAVPIFTGAVGDHPYGKWVEGTAQEYEDHLAAPPDTMPFRPVVTFSTKRLIDVFLYTQYAHQPDEKKQRQFEECLAQVDGKRAILTWIFLTEIWKCALEIGNAGRVIVAWFKQYCVHHGVSPAVLNSLREHHPGLGAAEKKEDRRERLFREKVEQLSAKLWEQAGCPASGPSLFATAARDRLERMLQE